MKEEVIENVAGDHSHDRRGFLTILDNVLTVGESAAIRRPPKRSWMGCKKWG
jgi:hypothetical protein